MFKRGDVLFYALEYAIQDRVAFYRADPSMRELTQKELQAFRKLQLKLYGERPPDEFSHMKPVRMQDIFKLANEHPELFQWGEGSDIPKGEKDE